MKIIKASEKNKKQESVNEASEKVPYLLILMKFFTYM